MFDLLQFHEHVAVCADDGTSVSYRELHDLSSSFAGHIDRRGLVLCLCRNTISSVLGYVACISGDFPVILIGAEKDKGSVDEIIEQYSPEYIWAPNDLSSVCHGRVLFSYEEYSLHEYNVDQSPVFLHPSLSLCLSTSGSTGSPKMVRLSKENLLSNAKSIVDYLGLTSTERPLLSLPMHYSYGLSILNSHLLVGATILLTGKTINQAEFWTFLTEQHASSFSGVPYIYEMMVRFRFLKKEYPDLKTFTQAGGKLSPDLVRSMASYSASRGKRFIVMYGQTEASPRMSYLPFEKASDKPGSIGIAVPGGQIVLIDDDGEIINEDNVVGEIVYSGPNVCMGYASNRSDLSLGDANNHCLKTGDMAYRDSDGYFFITGRKKRFVKIWGNRCSLDELEKMAAAIAPECACVGRDDLVTFAITDSSVSDKLLGYVSRQTGLNIKAFCVKILKKIPRTDSGKIDYSQILPL